MYAPTVGAASSGNRTLFHAPKVGNLYTVGQKAATSTPPRATTWQSPEKKTADVVAMGIGSGLGGAMHMVGGEYVLVGIMRRTFRNETQGTVQFLTLPSHVAKLGTYDASDVVISNANTFLARVTGVEPWDLVDWTCSSSRPLIHMRRVHMDCHLT